MLWWAKLCPPPPIHIEVLISNMTLFGDRVFQEAIKVKGGNEGGALIQ